MLKVESGLLEKEAICMVRERRFESTSSEATERFAAALGERLEAGTVLALEGDLGAGKTTFLRGVATGLGVEEPVSSPTYTLMHEYVGRLTLYHFDAWMEGREKAFLESGGAQDLAGDGVSAIEWAERVGEYLPEPRLVVRLTHQTPESRGIELSIQGESPGLWALIAGLESPEGVRELS